LFLIATLGVVSILLALLLTPIIRDRLGPLGFLDHSDGFRKRHGAAVPRVGGIAIALSYVITFSIALWLPFSYTHVLHTAFPSILRLTGVAAIIFITGVLDDLISLRAWQKLIGIGTASVLAYGAGIRVDIHLLPIAQLPWLSFPITVIWLIACANAFNLIDGMDGLAAGVGLFATVTMMFAALSQGNLPLAMATIPLAGCLIGFLRYNFNPASVFLGDSGSLLIGFLLGCYGALWSEKSVTLMALTIPVVAVAVPLLDVILSVARRFLRNRPIFEGDREHIHHKLLERGFSHKGAVLMIYGVCGLAATVSLLASALHNQLSGLLVILFCIAVWFAVQNLGYGEFAMAGEMFLKGKFRRIIDTETRLLELEAALTTAIEIQDCWTVILKGSKEFGFHGVRLFVSGRIFEETNLNTGPEWQIRIPLSGSQYINFYRTFGGDTNPLILNAFVGAVERGMKKKLDTPPTDFVRMPPAAAVAYDQSARLNERASA